MNLALATTLLLLSFLGHAALEPLGNASAPKGGTFVIGYPGYPKHLLYYLALDELSAGVNALVSESLMEAHPDTNELIPLLATGYTMSADKRLFTFTMDPKARFSDGKPVTAHDVKFTWDTIMNPKHKTAPLQSYYSSFESCRVVDDLTVEFKTKTLHFKNLRKLAELIVLPKHVYSKGDFNKAFNQTLVGSGPYTLEQAQQERRIVLARAPRYWGAALPQNIGRYNFDKIVFKAVPDYNVQFEIFKKGEIDYFYFLVSKMWATETDGPLFQKNYIRKIKAENSIPYGTMGVAWNMRRSLFQDRRVRLALSHLMNREKYIKELFYNAYMPASGVVPATSEYRSPENKTVGYEPKRARELLKEAGWEKLDSDGILVKGDLRFEFEMLADSAAMQRFLTVYQEDLKQMGIKMNIRIQDWATSIKLMDDRKFDATLVNRSRDSDPSDFGVMWSSKEADKPGSSNLTGYKNPEVDSLAEKIDQTFDKKARVLLVQKLDAAIAADQPMSFAWEPSYFRLAHWNKFSYPGKGYFAYSTWRDVFQYWWWDKDKVAKLEKAKSANEALP